MAQVDGELKIAARIDTSSVRQDSNKLAKTIQSVFSSYARDTKKASSSLLSLQNQMKKYVDELERARAEQKKIGETKIYSDEYKRMQSDLDKTRDRASKLKTEMDSLNAKRANLGKQTIMTNDYAKISNEYNKLGNQIDKLGDKQRALANLQKQASTDKEVAEIQKKIDGLETQINTTKELRNIQKSQMEEMKKEGNAFTTMQQAYRTGIGQTTSEYNNLIDKIRQVKSEYRSATSKASFLSKNISSPEFQRANITSGVDTEQYAKAGEKVTNLENKLAQLAARYNDVNGASKKSGNTLKTAFSKAKDMVKGVNSKLKELKTKSSNTFSDMAKNAKTSFWKILKYAFGIRSLFVLFKRLKKYIKEAFGAMAESVPQVRQEIDTLKINFTQLRNSLATAFQPIFSYVVPALNALCNALVSAMNVLANFFATLTGQKFIYKATKANDALADSIGGAGKAAKEANEDIAEYDKLIVINKNNDPNSGGGGSGSSNANAGAFEKVPSEVNKLAELIKDGWEESDFSKVGEYIGNSLKTALNKIPWAKLQKQASKLGSVFSTLINGFVEVPDLGNTIGKTIAEGLNTALTFINTAVHKLHWDSVGKFIADTLTSGLENFDWDKLSDTVTTGLKGVATAVSTFFTEVQKKLPSILTKVNKAIQDFVKNFPVDEISSAISGLVNTVLQVINGLLPNLSDLVGKAGQLIMETIKKIDWKQVGTLFSNAFRELIQSATELLKNLDWEAVGKAIGEFLAGIDWAGIANDLWELLKTLFKSAFNLLVKGLPALFKEAPIATTIIGLFAGLKLTGLATKLSGLFGGVISTALGGIATSGLSATIYSVFGTKGTIALLIGTAIAGWKLGETFIAPAVEKGLTYISQKYGTLARLEEQNLVEERKQKIAEVGISINGVRQEMKKYGIGSKEANAIAKKGFEDIAKQIDTTYTAEIKWRANIDKLSVKRRLGLITEKEKLEELQKIYDTTNRRMEKITAGAGLGLGKINEKLNGTSEELKETTKDLGKEAQTTAKHYTDMYKKSIIAPSKKATKSINNVNNSTKKLDTTTKQTAKDTKDSWDKANTDVEKSTSTIFDKIIKSSTNMKDNLGKNASVASTKTITSLNSIKKQVKATGISDAFKTAFTQISESASTESGKAVDSLDAISKTKVIIQNLDFSGMKEDIQNNESAIKAALINCLTIPNPTASIDAFSEALGTLPGLSSESKEALIKDFQAMRAEADNVAIKDKSSIKNSFWDAAKDVADKFGDEGASGFKGKIKSAFAQIAGSAKENSTGSNSIESWFKSAIGSITGSYDDGSSSGLKGKLKSVFETIRGYAKDNSTGSDSIQSWFKQAVTNTVSTYDDGSATGFKGKLASVFSAIKGYAKTNTTDDNDSIKSWFKKATTDTIKTYTTGSTDGFLEKIKGSFEDLNSYARTQSMGTNADGKGGIAGKFRAAATTSISHFTGSEIGFKSKIVDVFDKLNQNAKTYAIGKEGDGTGGIAGKFKSAATKTINNFTTDGAKGFKGMISGAFDALNKSASGSAGDIQSSYSTAATNTKNNFNGIQTPVNQVFSSMGTAGTTSAKAINNGYANASKYVYSNMRGSVIESVQNIFNKLANKFGFSTVSIPYSSWSPQYLAKGGVIPPNKEFLAVLGDQKQGVNIETPLATMIEAFNKALEQNGGNSSNKEPIVLQLDGRTVAQVVWDENQKRYKQTGNAKFA